MTSREAIAWGDEALIAQLGYKQEFKRAFTPLEVRPLHLSGASRQPRLNCSWDTRRCSGCPSALLTSSRPFLPAATPKEYKNTASYAL